MAIALEKLPITGQSCIGCGNNAWTLCLSNLSDYLTDDFFDIARCNHCGMQMTQPLPETARIEKYYPPRYRGNRHGFTGPIRSALRRRAVQAHFPSGFRGRLLDIGCGDGSFALHMKSHGWDVAATEIDPETIQRLSQQGIDAKLSASALADGFDLPFDAITCWHVLEHVEHPRELSQWVLSQLKPDGIFQATVPNVQSLQAKLFGRKWIHLDVPRHRQHFVPATLQSLLESAAFRISHRANFAFEYDWLGIIQSTLNCICTQPNVLFDQLIGTPKSDRKPAPISDKFISWVMTPAIALGSLPVMLAAYIGGDGATLTMTCRASGSQSATGTQR